MTGRWMLSFIALALPACAGGSALSSVGGTAFYRERIAMPPGATLEVSLEDISDAGAPAVVVGSVLIENPGNVPVAFEIPYDPADIDEQGSYSVRARILVDGRPRWVSAAANPVLTRGNDDRVEILLVAAGEDEPGDAEGGGGQLTGTRWKLVRVADHAVAVGEEGREPYLVFRADSGRVEGYGGCNQFGGDYTTDASTIEITGTFSTLMACVDGMDTERELFAALEAARSWSIEENHLELSDTAGERLARFEATPID